jgi:hypothetical protein
MKDIDSLFGDVIFMKEFMFDYSRRKCCEEERTTCGEKLC